MDACMVLLLSVTFAVTASGLQEAKAKVRNYYDALNVEPTATQRQIKKAFRSLALKYHPDKDKSAQAEENFREIAEAYKVLSSSENRKLYDLLGHEAFVKNASGVPQDEPSPDFDDIFHFFDEDLFDMDSDFMWTFTDDSEHHSFQGSEYTYVFPNNHENDFDDLFF